jgi:phage tail-like protein
MDSNGLRAFGLSLNTPEQQGGLYPWPLGLQGARVVTVEPAPHVLVGARLASRAESLRLAEVTVDPNAEPETVLLRDAFGHALIWSKASGTLQSLPARAPDGHLVPPLQLKPAPGEEAAYAAIGTVFDLAMSARDIVAVAGDALVLLDTRARFKARTVALPAGFAARRLAADPIGGVYVLDIAAARLAYVDGQPLATTGAQPERGGDTFAASEFNPDPVAVRAFHDATLPAGETPLDLACNATGTLLLLTRTASDARLRALTDDGRWSDPVVIARPSQPYSLGWLDDTRLVLLTRATILAEDGTPQPGRDPGAFVYTLAAAAQQRLRKHGNALGVLLDASGEYYPLRDLVAAPLVRSAAALIADGGGGARLFYPRTPRVAGIPAEPAPLARLSGATRATYGVLANSPRREPDAPPRRVRREPGVIETEALNTAWHRLYIEACVPRNTAIIVWLAANDGTPPAFNPDAPGARAHWHPHLIGHVGALPPAVAAALPPDTPRAAWEHAASEVPQGVSLLNCEREAGTTGLFNVLIQRAGLAVRALAGRRLWVTLELFGDGRVSPELVALRAYAGRVSYRDKHLPTLYREQVFGPEADMAGRATGADFLERYIGIVEGVFTSIEDRIAHAYRLTDAWGAPAEALPWLASWIGLAFEPGVSPERMRLMLDNAPALARQHGTLDGFKRALDIATGGAVTRGRLVVVEDFRLRRTMATILGAQLEDRDDPLTAGISRSGNSMVGDTLFLGDEGVKTFLALFRDLNVDPRAKHSVQGRQESEREAAAHALYDGLAYRATVLIHEETGDDEQGLVRRLAETYSPAHVKVKVAPARYPFLAAVASLVGADTYLRAPEPTQPVRINLSRLGYRDTLQGLGTLDARGGALGAGGLQ